MKESLILRAVRGLENLVFSARPVLIGLFILITLFFLASSIGLLSGVGIKAARLGGGVEKQVPSDHPYVTVAKKYAEQTGSGNVLLVAVEAKGKDGKKGNIFTKDYFDELNHIADDLFYLPGVDKAHMTYIFGPNVLVVELAEDGFRASRVVPDDFKPTPEGFDRVKVNMLKGGLVGRLISEDFTTALIVVPLYEHDPRTGAPLNYLEFSQKLDSEIKAKYEAQHPDIDIHIIGYARAFGEFAAAFQYIFGFFLITLAITAFLLYRMSHHWWLTAAPILSSLSAVIWQIGIVSIVGYDVDLYSVLIPFLILSIGVSHGVQMILSTGQLAAGGEESYHAARHSFRRLFLPGSVALVTAVVTFLTITTIEIPVIRELAATATIGIGALAFTNLIWLPLMVSYAKITDRTIAKMQASFDRREKFWYLLAILVQPRYAVMLSLGAAVIGVGAYVASEQLIVGDINQGVPELRPSSRYNQDTAFISSHFGLGVDSLLVFATGQADSCLTKSNVQVIDDFVDAMRTVPGVHGTAALSGVMKTTNVIQNEGNLRWSVISRDRHVLGQSTGGSDANRQFTNPECSVMPISLSLSDHKATTLTTVMQAAKDYIAAHPGLPLKLELVGGTAGTLAAINESVDAAQLPMLGLVYLAVLIICLATFRSPRAVICIIVPLALVSLIANGAMALLGIGLKVSTLPVTALGVGIGVDYGIYKFSRLSHYMGAGMSLQNAYIQTLRETGSAVIFTGLTLSVGVATWLFSPLQFQADMGLLLTLMFFMNMVGAIILLPALIGIMQMIKPQRVEDMARSSVLHHV